jgi:cytochrome P450
VSAPFTDTQSAAYDRNIHSTLARARDASWYADTPFGVLVLRYDDVHWLLHDKHWRELGTAALPAAGISEGPLWDWFHQILSNKEGEEPAHLRRFVSCVFTPRRAEALHPMMRATAKELVDAFVERGECEFVSEFAAGYPLRVIDTLIGVPPGDFTQSQTWANGLSLARFEIQEALPSLAQRLPGLASKGEVVWRIGSQVRGPESLPLRFEASG